MEKSSTPSKEVPFLLRVAPGLRNLLEYRREWLRHDAVAGVSVAAVALPTTLAYAQLIGFDPVVGLYAAILPLLPYAVFGTSRHLIYRAFRLLFHLGPVARAAASGLTTHSRTRRLRFSRRCQMKIRQQPL